MRRHRRPLLTVLLPSLGLLALLVLCGAGRAEGIRQPQQSAPQRPAASGHDAGQTIEPTSPPREHVLDPGSRRTPRPIR